MNRIKEVLAEKGIKQTWLAEKLGKSYNMVNSYVQNRRQPSLEIFFKISKLLDVSIEELFSIERTLEQNVEDEYYIDHRNEAETDYTSNESTERVPLVGSVSCGAPIFTEENIESYYSISKKFIKQDHRYFILRAFGDSMDKSGINNGDLVLVRLAQTADSGEKVVALIDNEATIKEIQVFSDKIILKPNSTNNQHQPIILTKDFRVQGIVVTIIPT